MNGLRAPGEHPQAVTAHERLVDQESPRAARAAEQGQGRHDCPLPGRRDGDTRGRGEFMVSPPGAPRKEERRVPGV
ncbi:hypothetical protein GCM10022625_34820 [Deinococcus aetherius]